MTLKGSETIGLSVMLRHGGRVVDKIEELLFDANSRRAVGYLLKNFDITGEKRVLLIEHVMEYREEGVVIEGEFRIKNIFEAGDEVLHIVNKKSYLTNHVVKEINGKVLGTLSDIYFDSKSGVVEKFEILNENSDITFTIWECQAVEIDKNSIYVDFDKEPSHDVENKYMPRNGATSNNSNNSHNASSDKSEIEELKEQISYLLKKMDQLSQQNDANNYKSNNHVSYKNELDREKVLFQNGQTNGMANTGSLLSRDPHLHEAVGQYLTKNILLEDDSLFAKKGDIVTHKMLHEAEEKGVLIELLSNTTFEKI